MSRANPAVKRFRVRESSLTLSGGGLPRVGESKVSFDLGLPLGRGYSERLRWVSVDNVWYPAIARRRTAQGNSTAQSARGTRCGPKQAGLGVLEIGFTGMAASVSFIATLVTMNTARS